MCVIHPGCENPGHIHRDCEEILHVLEGDIEHRIKGRPDLPMRAGDTITIPAGIAHNAHNTGDRDASMIICFSTAHRTLEHTDLQRPS